MITYFKSLGHTGTPFHKDVSLSISRIRDGACKDTVEAIRSENDKTKRNELKKKLPAICYSGRFSKRSDDAIIEHSGLICIDFDGFIDEWALLDARARLTADKYSYCVFTSPSGDGLKVLVKIPKDPANHKNYFLSLEKYYNMPEFDTTSKNISRICFESYDPEIYVNDNSEVWTEKLVEEHQSFNKATAKPTIKLDDNNEVIRRLMIWWNKDYGLVSGKRNNNTYVLAMAMNEYGIPHMDCVSALSQFESEDFPMSEINICISSAYKNIESHGTKFFEDDDKIDAIKMLVKQGVSEADLVKLNPNLPQEVVKSVVQSSGSTMDFWTKSSKGVVKHINHLYKDYLESIGYFKFYPAGSNNFIFVNMNNNTISDATEDVIKDDILEHLLTLDDTSIYNYFADKTKLFKEDHLSFLSKIDPVFMEDDKQTAYLYFNNCAVKVTPHGYETIDYMDISGYVWVKQKIDRNFKKEDGSEAVFKKFIKNISGGEADRTDSIESTIGYLLHSYKPPKYCPAVIINDEIISDNPEGGTGKGIFVNSISQLKKSVIIDGKAFSFQKSFPYQRVSADTQTLVFDDVSRNFEFERLFSVITEGITLEKKNKDEIHIPFDKSPKIIITTNYAIKGAGNSFDRRKWELEFSQHYSKDFTPEDEFGHQLFTDWDECEWSRFDNYMISNLQRYLKRGLQKSKFKNLKERKLIAETAMDFYEWAIDQDNLGTKIGVESVAQELYVSFTSQNPDYAARGRFNISHQKFYKWLDLYGEFMYNRRPETYRSALGKMIRFERKFDEQSEIKF